MTSWETARLCEKLNSDLGISEKLRNDAVDALCNSHLYTSTLTMASCFQPRMRGKTCLPLTINDAVDNVYKHLSYRRDLARFKPGDVVYNLTTKYISDGCGIDTLLEGTKMRILYVQDGYAKCTTENGTRFMLSLDDITHKDPEERKEEDMGTGNTHEVHLYAVNSFDFKPRKILKSYSKRKNTDSTIVFWNDGTKTIVKRAKDEPDNTYAAFTAALAIKLFGSNSALKKFIEKHTEEQIVKGKV